MQTKLTYANQIATGTPLACPRNDCPLTFIAAPPIGHCEPAAMSLRGAFYAEPVAPVARKAPPQAP